MQTTQGPPKVKSFQSAALHELFVGSKVSSLAYELHESPLWISQLSGGMRCTVLLGKYLLTSRSAALKLPVVLGAPL